MDGHDSATHNRAEQIRRKLLQQVPLDSTFRQVLADISDEDLVNEAEEADLQLLRRIQKQQQELELSQRLKKSAGV